MIAVLLSRVPAESQQPTEDYKTAILSQRAVWNKAMAARDTEALGRLLTPDFKSIGAAGEVSGITAFRSFFAAVFRSRPDLFYERTTVTIEKPALSRGYASEEGTWVERWAAPDGPTELRGRYYVMWRFRNGAWKQQAELYVPSACLGKSYCEPPKVPNDHTPLTAELTRAYAGWYLLSDNTILTIRAEENYLVGRSLTSDVTLRRLSDTEFAMGTTTLRFSRGTATTVEVVRNQQTILKGQRLEPRPPQ